MPLSHTHGDGLRNRTSDQGFSLVELVAYLALIVTMAAFIMPFTRSTLGALNLSNDARNLQSAVSLAKMRAAALFSKVRLRVDLNTRTFWVERWQKTGAPGWVAEGRISTLSGTVNFGFSTLVLPPPNTQAVIAQSPPCQDNAGANITGSACVVFNSRGIPIDSANAPFAGNALYLNDTSIVFGITAAAGGHIRLWRSNIAGGAGWALN